jgi:hypothetical protein
MPEVNLPKKRGRKKGVKIGPRTKAGLPKNLEKLSFDQLQALYDKVGELIKSKKETQIRLLKNKIAELEKM